MDSPKNRGGRPPRPGGPRDRLAKARIDRTEELRIHAMLRANGYAPTETGLRDFLLAQADQALNKAA